MKNNLIAELEAVVADLYRVRLPVEEAAAYGTILSSANKITRVVKEMKECAADEDTNQ